MANAAAPSGANSLSSGASSAAAIIVHRLPKGQTQVVAAPAGAPLTLDFASSDVKFGVQDVDLTISFADGGKVMPSGTFERLIDVTGSFPLKGFNAQSVTIASLPAGYAVNNATRNGENWTLQLDPTAANHLQLVYALPGPVAMASAKAFFSASP